MRVRRPVKRVPRPGSLKAEGFNYGIVKVSRTPAEVRTHEAIDRQKNEWRGGKG